jgi:hypothetical protein
MTEWIPVTVRLPRSDELSQDGQVLVCWGDDPEGAFISCGQQARDGSWYDDSHLDRPPLPYVTHWMKLPVPPARREIVGP